MSEAPPQNTRECQWRLDELARLLDARLILPHDVADSATVRGVTTDTRDIEAGQLFVALQGVRFDAHDFLGNARDSGAGALLVEREEALPPGIAGLVVPDALRSLGVLASDHLDKARHRAQSGGQSLGVIGVTGSYGKTSTRALLSAALAAWQPTHATQGNFNNEIGLPLSILGLGERHRALVLEMGMRGLGQIAYLAEIARPDVGVITGVGPQHVELLGSEENIALAKSELLAHLDSQGPGRGTSVLPADSPFREFLLRRAPGSVALFGASSEAHYRVREIETNALGHVEFTLEFPAQARHLESSDRRSIRVTLGLVGAHNAGNAAAAFAAAHVLGAPPELLVAGLRAAELPGARGRIRRLKNAALVIDDSYNAGPDSMRAALTTLLDWPGSGRRVAILGAMGELGDDAEAHHRAIGTFAGPMCELLVGVGGATRPLLSAALEAARGLDTELEAHWCADAADAGAQLALWCQPGDVILVKGSRSVGLETVVSALESWGEAL